MKEEKIISISNISIKYGDKEVLRDINLDVKKGDFIYFIGETGSGKSTLLRSLYKGVDFNNGEIKIMGQELSRLKHQQIPLFRRKLGIIFQDFQLLNDRNVHQNLSTILQATGWKSKEEINKQKDQLRLDVVSAETKLKTYSTSFEQSKLQLNFLENKTNKLNINKNCKGLYV